MCRAHATDETKQYFEVYHKQNTTKSERERKKKGKPKHNKSIFEAAAVVLGAIDIDRQVPPSSYVSLIGLGLFYPVCRLLPAFAIRRFRTSANPYLLMPLLIDATGNESAAHSIPFRHIVVRNTSNRRRIKKTKNEWI